MKFAARFMLSLFLAGCSQYVSVSDAGDRLDAGTPFDSGWACSIPLPNDLSAAERTSLTAFYSDLCGSSPAQALAMRSRVTCDAGPGQEGYVAEGSCAEGLTSVAWVYGFPGDTYQCFYAPDGGGLVGAINYGDWGTQVAGCVATCTMQAPSQCTGRDGG